MRIIAVLVLVFGVALAGGALFFASEYFKEIKASMAQQGPDTVRVLVAKQALTYGATIEPGNLQWVEWPKSAVPPGAFTSVEALLGEKGDQKRIVLRSIDPGEPLLETKITKAGESPRMSMNLGAGMRAVSISIDAVSGVSGFVASGDRVDILMTRTLEGQLVSSVILQDVTVIAVDQRSNSEGASPRLGQTVTVEVDTEKAQRLSLAQQVGKLSLILRGIGETSTNLMAPITAGDLSGITKVEEAPERTVRVRRAGALQDTQIGDPAAPAEPAPTGN
ncbi:MAG TPA: Flp pilus assembly protein CpaB [Hyphomicrobiaceae bacterium]|nr:Flp pilus assembly protein CpaB [Hyphomicrobiaceae bacterium]